MRSRAHRFILAILIAVGFALPAGAQQSHRFAMAVFHFNIQYVAGGLYGFVPYDWPGWTISEQEVEDMIIRESFAPIVDLFYAHPQWGVNLEMQGRMLEIMAERFPEVFGKLREMAQDGQVEITSFHYSDQLFIAYPRQDWEKSAQLTARLFEDLEVPLGGAVFCQEGQASIGMAGAMEEYGYTVMVWPKNLWKYQHGEFEADPYYTFGNLRLVIGPKDVNYNNGEILTTWTFLNDGELLATGDLDPYFPPVFKHKPEKVAEYEARLQDLEDQGYAIATVSQYVDALEALEIEPSILPPLLDGTWQPQSTNGTFRWLGGSGLWNTDERDNQVRSLLALAHREIVAAETILATAWEQMESPQIEARPDLDEAWRLLSLGEVSDSTGINPFRGEVEYGIAHATEALRLARGVIEEAKEALGMDRVLIDSYDWLVTEVDEPEAPVPNSPRYALEIEAEGRYWIEQWYKIPEFEDAYRVELWFSPAQQRKNKSIRVRFPGFTEEILFSPALSESMTRFERSDFAFEHFPLALCNGLIGLNRNLFVIKDMSTVHVAAFVYRDELYVDFRDDVMPWNEATTWVFYIFRGSEEEALNFAERLNVNPVVVR